MKTINLELTWAEGKTHYDGGSTLTFVGRTPGDQSIKVNLRLVPSSVGYLAERLHGIVADHQKTLDEAKRKLRGDDR